MEKAPVKVKLVGKHRGVYKIQFSYVGYVSELKEITLDTNIKLNIDLVSNSLMKEFTVVGTESEKIQEKTQMSSIDVSMEKVKSLPVFLGEHDVMKTIHTLFLAGFLSVAFAGSAFAASHAEKHDDGHGDGHSMEEYDVKPMINRNTKSTSPHSLLALVKTEAISRHLLGILNTRESEDAVQSLYSAATLKGMYGSHYSTSKWTPKHIMEQAIEKYYHSVAQNDYAPVLLRVWMVDYLRGQMGIKPGNDESGT